MEPLEKVLSLLSGDLNYNQIAEAKSIVKHIIRNTEITSLSLDEPDPEPTPQQLKFAHNALLLCVWWVHKTREYTTTSELDTATINQTKDTLIDEEVLDASTSLIEAGHHIDDLLTAVNVFIAGMTPSSHSFELFIEWHERYAHQIDTKKSKAPELINATLAYRHLSEEHGIEVSPELPEKLREGVQQESKMLVKIEYTNRDCDALFMSSSEHKLLIDALSKHVNGKGEDAVQIRHRLQLESEEETTTIVLDKIRSISP